MSDPMMPLSETDDTFSLDISCNLDDLMSDGDDNMDSLTVRVNNEKAAEQVQDAPAVFPTTADSSNSALKKPRATDKYRRVVNGKTMPQCFKCRKVGHVAKFCRGTGHQSPKPTMKLFFKLLLDAKSKHGVKTLFCCICRQPSGSEAFCYNHL